jgi:hypothetical protein
MSLVICAGILGTLIMTLFVEIIAHIIRKPFHVVSILSHMLRFGKDLKPASKGIIYIIALLVHYGIGILFSCCFDLCLNYNLIEMHLSNALIFGGFAGLIGIGGWRIFFAIHPAPPKIILSQYLTTIWVGHILYAIGVFYTYLIV